jgi:hypothetical protein
VEKLSNNRWQQHKCKRWKMVEIWGLAGR